ncbi:MAG: UDP-N-acetyl-D-mannosaminuronic acid dehydrogenase, partial [Actinomycetota bacterium]
QLVSARTERAVRRAETLFGGVSPKLIRLEVEEAELAKLFTNTWRYIKFATANQLYMIANDFGLDFGRIRAAMTFDYPRAADLPGAGFAAGPCLLKDTMQLAAFNNNNFVLGHASMLVNEGLPLYIVSKMEDSFDLRNSTVGVLGMAFKGGSDDTRDSLAYKLRRILRFKARKVMCTDPYVTSDPSLDSLDDVLKEADVLILAAPHPEYRDLPTRTPLVDVWGFTGSGTQV